MDKDNFRQLMIECLILDDLYEELEDMDSCWLNLVKCEDHWLALFEHCLDSMHLKQYFNNQTQEQRLDCFKFGISCLIHFIQANFTGPELAEDTRDFLESDFFSDFNFAERLIVNREDISVNTKYPCLLACAELVFDSCLVHHTINLWWGLRVMKIHQDVMDELSPTILSNADQFYKLLVETNLFDGEDRALLDLELLNLYLPYRNFMKVRKHLSSATDILKTQFKLNKQKDMVKNYVDIIFYLTDSVNNSDCDGSPKSSPEKAPIKPSNNRNKNTKIEIPKVLDKIPIKKLEFVKELTNFQQKLCLAYAQESYQSTPLEEMNVYNIKPFLDVILNQNHINYTVKLATLLLICNLDLIPNPFEVKTVENISNVSKCFTDQKPLTVYRLKDFFSCSIPPVWKVKKLLGNMLFTVGDIKKSLLVYTEIKAWEDVLACYSNLKETKKAIKLVDDLLKKDPNNVRYLCLKGDAENKECYYEKAWDLSKRRSHRVERHWGHYLLNQQKIKESIPHFEKSLSINPYQPALWLCLGCTALSCEIYPVAVTALRRYTSLEPSAFRAWNNLAQAYLKTDNKLSAHYAISEALKYRPDFWRIWENLLVVNVDLSFNLQAIETYNRILDLKEDYINLKTLKTIIYKYDSNNNYNSIPVTNITRALRISKEKENNELLKQSQSLIGRLISIHPLNVNLWELYADLTDIPLLRLHRLQRAFRLFIKNKEWNQNNELRKNLVSICTKMCQLVLSDSFDYRDRGLVAVKGDLLPVINGIKEKHGLFEKDLKEALEKTKLVEQNLKKYKDKSILYDQLKDKELEEHKQILREKQTLLKENQELLETITQQFKEIIIKLEPSNEKS